MLIDGMPRKTLVEKRHRLVGYLLCVVIMLEAATAQQTSAGEESSEFGGKELNMALEQPVRRHAFSVTQDLVMLTKLVRDESQRRRMQNAKAFFNALHKRQQQLLKQHSFAVPSQNVRRKTGQEDEHVIV